MPDFPDDIFTEPAEVDPDTLANLGPLRRLAGIWEGQRGVDINPKADGPETREYYERIAGHDVYEPPFPHLPDKPPVPTLALWSRRDGIVAPRAARGHDHERDKAVEIDTYHTGFAVHRPVLTQVVNEIRTFLAEVEGRPPALQPMVVAGPLAKTSRVARTA